MTTIVPTMIIAIFLLLEPPWTAAQLSRTPPPTEFGSGPPRVDLKMAIVMILLVTVFFVLGFLSVYTRQCAQERFRNRLELSFVGASAGNTGAWSHRGLPADVLVTFPVFLYSAVKGLKIGKGSLECAVCLSEFDDSETLRLIPKCNHVFHRDCIDAWLEDHSTCPVCRAHLPGGEFPAADGHVTLAEFLTPVPDPGSRVSEEVIIPPAAANNKPGTERSKSTGFKSTRVGSGFPRSLSTGHLPVRPGESLERFTLRLPEEVRTRLVDLGPLPRVGSGRRGFRSWSVRRKDGSGYERFEPDPKPEGRWVFTRFVSRSGSVRSLGAGSSSTGNVGERSTDRLRPEDQV